MNDCVVYKMVLFSARVGFMCCITLFVICKKRYNFTIFLNPDIEQNN